MKYKNKTYIDEICIKCIHHYYIKKKILYIYVCMYILIIIINYNNYNKLPIIVNKLLKNIRSLLLIC